MLILHYLYGLAVLKSHITDNTIENKKHFENSQLTSYRSLGTVNVIDEFGSFIHFVQKIVLRNLYCIVEVN